MPIEIKGREYSLRKATFIWGFNNEDENSITPVRFPDDNPLAVKASTLLKEIARCGWDIPGFNVELTKSESRTKRLFSFVSAVAFNYNNETVKLCFDVSLNSACESYSTNFIDYYHVENDDKTIYADKLAANDPEVGKFDTMIDHLLVKLNALPTAMGSRTVTSEGDLNIVKIAQSTPLPAPQISPVLYARVPKENLQESSADGSMRMFGPRLLPLCTLIEPEGLHERVFDSFIYASTNPNRKVGNGIHTPYNDDLIVEIRPTDMTEIYVIDGSKRRETSLAYEDLMERTGRDFLTPEEAEEIFTSVARTMTPITEYRGGFEEPTYLIGRYLLPGEARVIKGPTEVTLTNEGVDTKVIDVKTGRKITLRSEENKDPRALEAAATLARSFAQNLNTEALIPQAVTAAIATSKRKHYTAFVEEQLRSGQRDEVMEMLLKPSP